MRVRFHGPHSRTKSPLVTRRASGSCSRTFVGRDFPTVPSRNSAEQPGRSARCPHPTFDALPHEATTLVAFQNKPGILRRIARRASSLEARSRCGGQAFRPAKLPDQSNLGVASTDHDDTFASVETIETFEKPTYDLPRIIGVTATRPQPIPEGINLVDKKNGGDSRRALSKSAHMAFSMSSIDPAFCHLAAEPTIIGTLHVPANAEANKVFPHPGGPYSKTPRSILSHSILPADNPRGPSPTRVPIPPPRRNHAGPPRSLFPKASRLRAVSSTAMEADPSSLASSEQRTVASRTKSGDICVDRLGEYGHHLVV